MRILMLDVLILVAPDLLFDGQLGDLRTLVGIWLGAEHVAFEALLLPAGFQTRRPSRIGWNIVADVDRRWRALEYVQLFRRSPNSRDDLNRRSAGADDANRLVFKVRQIRAGIAVVETRGMKRVAPIALHAFDARQLGFRKCAVRNDDKAGPTSCRRGRFADAKVLPLRPNESR